VGSRERGAGKKRARGRDCSKKFKNEKNTPKIEICADVFFFNLILVKIWTYYRGFKRASYRQKLKKVCVREREN
jgi:hypothetical protein